MSLLQESALPGVKSTAAADWHVIGDYYLADPLFLLFVPLALGALWWGRSRRGRAAGRVGALPTLALPRTLVQRLSFVPVVLQGLALCGLCAALARPVRANLLRTSTSEGVDIALVVDRSGSMQYKDLDPKLNRLEVVKQVVGDFAVRRMTDRIGAADNVALITFARYPQFLCPFTLDVGALRSFLDNVQLVQYEAEDGTAIGRGLAKAVAVLAGSKAKSKVVVLLTDGENNVDDITPATAAELAAEKGVRVYTVLAGRYVYQQDVFGRIFVSETELDPTELQAIADKTGARFFRAKDREKLEQVYAEIEQLERTPRTEQRFTETFDLYPYLLLPALVLYGLGWLSVSTWARRVL